MNFEELSRLAGEVGTLPKGHPMFNLEETLLSTLEGNDETGYPIHQKEHDEMLERWGLTDEEGTALNNLNGKRNRVWHILLHFKFWKELGIRQDLIDRLNNEFPEIALDDITLPRVKGE